MNLWGFQAAAVESIRLAIKAGYRDILVVSPTGSGKTVIASHVMNLARERFKDSLFLAHRREIIHQTSGKLDNFDCPHGLIMSGERRSVMQHVQLGSIQTYHPKFVVGGYEVRHPDLLVIDEAHRSLATTYREVRSLHPNAILIGLTATPCLSNGRGLGSMFTRMVETVSIEQLIAEGYLVTPKVFAPSVPELHNVHTANGDYKKDELEEVMDEQELVGNVVSDWLVRARDRKTVVFASGVRHSMHLNEQFRLAGVRSEHIDGTTPKHRRDEILVDLEHGDLEVVTNSDVLLEGWDCPPVSCAVLARPTKSYGLFLQMAGRALRACEGKEDCYLIDHAGAVYRHGFPQDAGEWSLDPDSTIDEVRRKKKEHDPQPITCRECLTVYERGPHCPECGWLPTKQAQDVSFNEGRLRELPRIKVKKDDRQVLWDSCMWRCIKTNKKIGVAAHMYKKKMGVFPAGLKMLPSNKKQWRMMAGDFYESQKNRKLSRDNEDGDGVQGSGIS